MQDCIQLLKSDGLWPLQNRPVKRVAESSLKTYIISSCNGWALYQSDGFNQTWIIIIKIKWYI